MPYSVRYRPTAHLHVGHRHYVANVNPVRMDPTRTTMIRRAFEAEIKRRFKKLIAAVWKFLDEEDELGLKIFTTRITLHQRDFQFRTDAGKLQAFNDWVKQQIEANVISNPASMGSEPWTAKYIESAYKKGMINAYIASKQEGLTDAAGVSGMTQEQFLRSAFLQPEATGKVQLLATRSFEELKGVSSAMGQQMNRILAQGMIDGSGPDKIAKEMDDKIDNLTSTRALLIARTEVINAHAEGQLDAFEELGVEDLGIKAEWSTAGDDRVCPECASLEGQVFTIEEARGMIPVHPNCRCSFYPTMEKVTKKEEKEAPPSATWTDVDFVKSKNFISSADASYQNANRGSLPGALANPFGDLQDPVRVAKLKEWGVVPEIRAVDELKRIASSTRFELEEDKKYFFGMDKAGVDAVLKKDEVLFKGSRHMGLTADRASNYATTGENRGAVFEVVLPKGSRVVHANVFDLNEAVMLPGSRMRVLSDTIKEVGGIETRYIKLELLEDGTVFTKRAVAALEELQKSK